MKHSLVTGASGGLGGALAKRLADHGQLLSLWGRNVERLDKVRLECESRGAVTQVVSQDIREHDTCREKLREAFAARPVDMAILNAGVSSGITLDGGLEPAEDACRTVDVDCTATINMASTLLNCMRERGSGHIVFISSIAGLYPLPASPAYSAAKAGLAYYAKGLRLGLRGNANLRISIVYPGYIDSRMSRRLKGPQPFRVTADMAAERIVSSLGKGKDVIAFPPLLALGSLMLHFLPLPLASFFLKYFTFSVDPDAESPYRRNSGKPTKSDRA